MTREVGEPITAPVIAEWERDGILPIPVGDPARSSYPAAAKDVILLLISLDQVGRAHLDISEVLRRKARTLHAGIALTIAATQGG